MSFSRRVLKSLKAVGVVVLAGVVTTATQAQTGGPYAQGKGYFPNPIAPYTGRDVPKANMANTGRIDTLVRDGRLMLSLNDAIALALENNLDLAIARYNLPIADTDILRTKAGSTVRGVATGLVSGTPGGTGTGVTGGASGGGAGGTSTAAGGAGTGTSGIVSSTLGAGPAVESFDPILSSSLSIQHAATPLSSVFVSGVPFLQQNTGVANFSYAQAFPTGTSFSLAFNNSRQTTNSIRNLLNPTLNADYRLTFRQHLLEGFGLANNRRFITIAKNNREISDVAFRQQVISTVSQIQNIYWDLVNAYEDVRAKERSVALAERLLADNQKQVQIGTLAPIEVVRAQSEVAARNQDLIVSQTNLQLQQLLMKNAITRNLTDQTLAGVPVIPTDTMSLPQVEPVVPVQDLIADALAHRPELALSQIDLTNRQITKKAARNSLLPTVDLTGWYGTSALGGSVPAEVAALPVCTPGTVTNCRPPDLRSTNYGNTFQNLWGNDFKDYGVALSINIPIRNRAAQADQVRSELEFRQAEMRLQQLQNQIRIEVRNAQFAVTQNRARVDAAIKGRQLAQESLDAEQKKYALGASTNYNVLQAQRDLAAAESSLVAASSAYEKSKVELDRVTGLTLTHLGVEIADAESGNVRKMPNVPGVAPRQDLTPTQQQQVPQGGATPQGTPQQPQAELTVSTPVTN
ncbi:MAG TPA: TolC family protein [Terriglobales bacterium]|nr:TolC family protein [Terriglobales bacterium]